VGSFGFAAVVAFWAIGAYRRVRRAPSIGARVTLWTIVGLHGIVPFVYWPAFAFFSQRALRAGRDAAVCLPLHAAPGEQQPLVLLTVSDPPTGLYLPFIRREAGLPPLSRYWLLSLVPVSHRVKRIDARTFELAPVGRRFLDTPFEKIFRRR